MDKNPQHFQPLKGNSQQNSAWQTPVHQTTSSNHISWLSPLRDIQLDYPSTSRSTQNQHDNPIDRIDNNLFSERATNTSDNVESSTSTGYQNYMPTINHTWPPLPPQDGQSQVTTTSHTAGGSWPKRYYKNRGQPELNMERSTGEHFNISTGPETTKNTSPTGSYTTQNTRQMGAWNPSDDKHRDNNPNTDGNSETPQRGSSLIWEQGNNLSRGLQTPWPTKVHTYPTIDPHRPFDSPEGTRGHTISLVWIRIIVTTYRITQASNPIQVSHTISYARPA